MKGYSEIIGGSAYKGIQEVTNEELEVWELERAICQQDFLHFLSWVKVLVPPVPGVEGETIQPLEVRWHVREIIKALKRESLISVLKARQIWVSTVMASYVVWTALSQQGSNTFLFSQGQAEAKELLQKCRVIYEYLPSFMKFQVDPDSTEAMGFPVMKSMIRTLPSTASAGIGYTATLVVWDEHAKHEYADQNFIHAKPIIDRGAQAVSIFTADPMGNDNLATAIFEAAIKGENGFHPLFFPYNVVPGRDDEWYERTKRSIPNREIARISPDLYMTKNYPRSIEEALSMAESAAVFDKRSLGALEEDCRSQINFGEGWEIDNDVCHVYKDYHYGNSYIAGSDVGQGVGGDYSVTCIMDVKTGDIVADIMSNKLKPDEFAYHSVQLLKHFHNPLWWVEHNITGGGRDVIKKAVELGYRRLGYRGDRPILWSKIADNEVIRRVGFFTDEKARNDLFGALIPAINDFQIRIYNKEGLRQFFSLIRNANKNLKIEGVSGSHDDYPIATGICWLRRHDAIGKAGKIEPIRTLDFEGHGGSSLDRLMEKIKSGRV